MTKQMADFKTMYANPFYNVAMTFIEPFPVGLLMTWLVSASSSLAGGAEVCRTRARMAQSAASRLYWFGT